MIEPYVFAAFLIPALVAGMWVCERRSSRPDSSRRAYLAGVGGGIIGARFWYALQYGDFSIAGGWASWGFVLGGSISAVCWLRWETGRAAFGEFADAVAPALALGGAFLRVACFWIGCNFGKPSGLPWAVTYGPEDPAFRKQLSTGLIAVDAPTSLPVHPTQLYESAALLAAAVLLLCAPRLLFSRRRPGELFLIGVLYYSVFRFLVEFIRDDAGGVFLGPLTFAQGTSLLALGIVLVLFPLTRNARSRQQLSIGHEFSQ